MALVLNLGYIRQIKDFQLSGWQLGKLMKQFGEGVRASQGDPGEKVRQGRYKLGLLTCKIPKSDLELPKSFLGLTAINLSDDFYTA